MKKLFALADQYIQESDWKMLAALKFCLFSMGVLVGSCLTARAKTRPASSAVWSFVGLISP